MEVSELFAGDIGAIAKLTNTKTGDTLSTKTTPIMYGRTEYSKPYTYMKYVVKNKGDEDKVSQALQRMMAEDVTLKAVNDSEKPSDPALWNGRSTSGDRGQQAGGPV